MDEKEFKALFRSISDKMKTQIEKEKLLSKQEA